MVNFISSASGIPASGAYEQLISAPNYIQGVFTGNFGIVGSASWGPPNTPVYCGSPTQFQQTFGPISAASLADPQDLPTAAMLAFGQTGAGDANGGQVAGMFIRATVGTEAVATGAVNGTGTVAQVNLLACWPGVLGNQITKQLTAGTAAGLFTLTITPPASLGLPEVFANIGGTGAAFWTNLANAINFGSSATRGPSIFVDATIVAAGALAPLVDAAPVLLIGGTDARTLADATIVAGLALFGTIDDASCPGAVCPAGVVGIASVAAAAAPLIAAGIKLIWPLPLGMTTAAALTAVATAGIASTFVHFSSGDWTYFYDTVNAVTRLTNEAPMIVGRAAVLPPEVSPLNKQVALCSGKNRITRYSLIEIGQLEQAGIMVITNPIPAGSVYGIRTSLSTATDAVSKPYEKGRMDSFLARSFAGIIGTYVGQNQGTTDPDPWRSSVETAGYDFLTNLLGRIDSFSFICSYAPTGAGGFGINTPSSIAAHFGYAFAKVRYLSSVMYFVLALEGGTTVNVSVSQGT